MQLAEQVRLSGGVKEIVEAFEKQTCMHRKSSSHSHKSSAGDEKVIMEDLRSLRPFKQVNGREFEYFKGISHNPASPLDENEFVSWINRHKNNILKHFPASKDSNSDQDSSAEEIDE